MKTLTGWTALEAWQRIFFRIWLCSEFMRVLDPGDDTPRFYILGYGGRGATRL